MRKALALSVAATCVDGCSSSGTVLCKTVSLRRNGNQAQCASRREPNNATSTMSKDMNRLSAAGRSLFIV